MRQVNILIFPNNAKEKFRNIQSRNVRTYVTRLREPLLALHKITIWVVLHTKLYVLSYVSRVYIYLDITLIARR